MPHPFWQPSSLFGSRFHPRFPTHRISPFIGRRSFGQTFGRRQRQLRRGSSLRWNQVLDPPYIRRIRIPLRRSGRLSAPIVSHSDQRLVQLLGQWLPRSNVPQAIIGWSNDDDENAHISISTSGSGVHIANNDNGIGIHTGLFETVDAAPKITSVPSSGIVPVSGSGIVPVSSSGIVPGVGKLKDAKLTKITGGIAESKIAGIKEKAIDGKLGIKKLHYKKSHQKIIGKDVGAHKSGKTIAKAHSIVDKVHTKVDKTKLVATADAGVITGGSVILGGKVDDLGSAGAIGEIDLGKKIIGSEAKLESAAGAAIIEGAELAKDVVAEPAVKIDATINDADTVNIAVDRKVTGAVAEKPIAVANGAPVAVDAGIGISEEGAAAIVKPIVGEVGSTANVKPIVDNILIDNKETIVDKVAVSKQKKVVKEKLVPVMDVAPEIVPVMKMEPAIMPVEKVAPKIIHEPKLL